MTMILLYSLLFFFIGAIPFSYLLGKLFNLDITRFGDKNPGAYNAFSAGGIKLGLPSLLMDFLKGAVPVFLYKNQITEMDFTIIPVSIAPVLGHAFSPFLRFKGGKAIAVSFGIWAGLTTYQAPMIIGSIHLFQKYMLKVLKNCWRIIIAISSYSLFALFMGHSIILFLIGIIDTSIIAIKHWDEIRNRTL